MLDQLIGDCQDPSWYSFVLTFIKTFSFLIWCTSAFSTSLFFFDLYRLKKKYANWFLCFFFFFFHSLSTSQTRNGFYFFNLWILLICISCGIMTRLKYLKKMRVEVIQWGWESFVLEVLHCSRNTGNNLRYVLTTSHPQFLISQSFRTDLITNVIWRPCVLRIQFFSSFYWYVLTWTQNIKVTTVSTFHCATAHGLLSWIHYEQI